MSKEIGDGGEPIRKRDLRHINQSQWMKLIWIVIQINYTRSKSKTCNTKKYKTHKNFKTIREMPTLTIFDDIIS